MEEVFNKKHHNKAKKIGPNSFWLSIPVIFTHLFVLSLAIVPKIEIQEKKKISNTINLDQFSLKKNTPSVISKSSSSKRINTTTLNLGNLGLGVTTPSVQNNVAHAGGFMLEDRVSKTQASIVKNNSVTMMERSEARELLNRHRQRLRSPDIQYNQESKVQSLNNKLGSFQPGQVTDFNISIVPNQKNSKEDLNSIERKFYAFYVRLSDKYENVISSTMINSITKRPQLKTSLYDRHTLQAKIVYDKNGEIVSTKILKSSDAMDVHETFEDIVALLKLPNVPQGLLDDDEQYTVYFTFQIN